MTPKSILHSLVQEFQFKKVHWSDHYHISDEFAANIWKMDRENPINIDKYGKTSIDKQLLIIHFEEHNVYFKIKSTSTRGSGDWIIYQVVPVEIKHIEWQVAPKTVYPEWFVPPYDLWEGIVPSACPQVGDKVSLMMCGKYERIVQATINKVCIENQRFYATTDLGEDCGGMPFSWYRTRMGWMWA